QRNRDAERGERTRDEEAEPKSAVEPIDALGKEPFELGLGCDPDAERVLHGDMEGAVAVAKCDRLRLLAISSADGLQIAADAHVHVGQFRAELRLQVTGVAGTGRKLIA